MGSGLTVQQLFQIRARQHQADAELLQALQATMEALEKVTEERNKLAEAANRPAAPQEKE